MKFDEMTLEDKLKFMNDKERVVKVEIQRVMSALGRTYHDGDVKGDHLYKILKYLIETETEQYDKTVAKLSLLIGIGQRYVKENYLQGIEAFDFISIETNGRLVVWKWNLDLID